jgi:outer membrane protein OmpA-like peptidoglycan-associated protein
MKKILSLLVFTSIMQFCFAQVYDVRKINKKAVQLYSQAIDRAQDGNLVNAAGILLQCIALDKNYVDAYLSLAGIYGQLKNHNNCIKYYEEAFALDSDYTAEYKLPYSINLAAIGEFEKALLAINQLLDKHPPESGTTYKAATYRKKCFEFAVAYGKKYDTMSYIFAPQNMGSNINTRESEYFPSLTIDGKELVFTRRINNFNEDFYFSRKKDTAWDLAQPMPGNVNTPENEGAQNISLDGQWLVFTACNRRDGFGSCDLYISYNTPEGWGGAINLGGKINTDQWESQPCLSPDKRDIYFTSRRFGGYGGSDIYVSHMLPNGRWGEPENLGPEVNTSGDEASPFIHADNQTLYFTSTGLPGYGGTDLFFVKKGPNNVWSIPVNLGYPINTINDEGTLFITADGKTAYYASDRSDSRGGLDIYHFELREDIRPYQTLWVKGKVFDKKTGKGLPSAVELTDLGSKHIMSKIQTDETGNYLITLPVGKDYAFNVNRKGYLFYSDQFLLQNKHPDSTYEKNIPLQPLEANASIVLKNIFFDVNKYDVKPESQVELDKVVELLNENPGLKIEISGYTDNIGKPADNLVLSNNRAKAVVTYLINHQISSQRLVSKGYGETNPIADNLSEEGRALNRRTELKILSQ